MSSEHALRQAKHCRLVLMHDAYSDFTVSPERGCRLAGGLSASRRRVLASLPLQSWPGVSSTTAIPAANVYTGWPVACVMPLSHLVLQGLCRKPLRCLCDPMTALRNLTYNRRNVEAWHDCSDLLRVPAGLQAFRNVRCRGSAALHTPDGSGPMRRPHQAKRKGRCDAIGSNMCRSSGLPPIRY